MDAPPERIRIRRARRGGSGSSKELRAMLLSLGVCGLALSVVLVVWGLLVGNHKLVAIAAWYPPLSLLALVLRWILIQVRQHRKRGAKRRRAEPSERSPVLS